MSKVNLIATAYQCYGGAWFKSGEPFVADSESDASELCCIGFAKLAPGTYVTRDMVAVDPGTPDALAEATGEVRKKRQYNRRDMVAAQ